MKQFGTIVVAIGLMGGAAFAQTMPAKIGETPKGKVLVNEKGMTLYVFDKDSTGKSACNGPCAESWPPLTASDSDKASGEWTIVTRDDGKKMWAYRGDGKLNGAWHVATP